MNSEMIFRACRKNLPGILSAAAAGGVVLTGWLSHEAGRRVAKDDEMPKTFKEKVKKHWKNYIPTAISGLGTIFCIAGAHKLHLSREASMAAAVAFYKALSEDWEDASFDKFSDAGLKDNVMVPNRGEPPYMSQTMKIKIWEPYTKQWLEASQQDILWAELTANKMLQQRGTVTLNDVILMLGAKKKREGAKLGWSWDDEMFNEASSYYYGGGWIDMCPQWDDSNGEMKFVLDYGINPNDISEFL